MRVTDPAVPKVPALVALAIAPLPLAPLQPLLATLLRKVLRRHPGIFARLGRYADKRFGLQPTDLPFAFLLEPGPDEPRVAAVRHLPRRLDVRIAGPLAGLVGLVDGSYDGDALFFSRDLLVEGDMEAVLALRNAIEDARIDLLREGCSVLGPIALPVETLLRGLFRPRRAAQASEAGSWS